jgi:hypothetical protein
MLEPVSVANYLRSTMEITPFIRNDAEKKCFSQRGNGVFPPFAKDQEFGENSIWTDYGTMSHETKHKTGHFMYLGSLGLCTVDAFAFFPCGIPVSVVHIAATNILNQDWLFSVFC